MDANTIEAPGEFDATLKLRPAEPYFMLIGRDRLAPKLVEDWGDANRTRALADFGSGRIDRAKLELELRQSTNAEMIAADMREFKRQEDRPPQPGDAPKPEPVPVTYSGHVHDEATQARDADVRGRTKVAQTIDNGVAEMVDASDLLRSMGYPDEAADLMNVVDRLKSLSKTIRPVRALVQA